MNIGSLTEVINLLKQLIDVKNTTEAVLASDVKPKYVSEKNISSLECATPESLSLIHI